jgi:flagellar biosynthetic protein FliR
VRDARSGCGNPARPVRLMVVELAEPAVMGMLRAWWWPFLRVSGFLLTAPIIGTRALPRRLRVLLAVVLTGVLAPLVKVDATLAALEPLSAGGLLIVAQQVTIGAALGLVLRMVFVVFEFAGQVIAQQMGLGFAAMVDPASGMQVPVVSQFYVVMATLLFFATNTHLQLIQLLADSFEILPIGTRIGHDMLAEIMRWSSDLLALAVMLMLPIITALLVVNLIFAVMTRSAPQLNIFAVGFPITLLFGVIMLLLTLPSLSDDVGAALDAGFSAAYALLQHH